MSLGFPLLAPSPQIPTLISKRCNRSLPSTNVFGLGSVS